MTGQRVVIGSRDFRLRPDDHLIDPQSGPSQFGRNRDDWGNWFGVQNSYPLWHYVLADHYIRRNAFYASPNPRSRTEAMHTGLAIVTTDSHGESDYIKNGINGFCSNDMDELKDFLEYLLKNPDQTQKIGQKGRETAQRFFHINDFISQWNDLLKDVLN